MDNGPLSIAKCQLLLKKYWGYDNFRGVQTEIIESVLNGHDTLGLMPTGGGKSICFQVPALAMDGVCLVVTPLIALMKDQVARLRHHGIPAAAVYSDMQHEAIITTLENCILGSTKLLYVSPERLSSSLFQKKVQHMKVSMITVDEAHCISQWGYDFRPSYLEIAKIRLLHPQVPVLALTATATPRVVDDICDKLRHPDAQSISSNTTTQTAHSGFQVFTMSFERKNLAYQVYNTADKEQELIHLLECSQGAAIVYVRSRRRTKELAEMLVHAGLSATFFHAGLEHVVRDERQRAWQQGHVRIMVATNAFGMGIDKADVRLVIHMDCPDSVEAYFQEAGRAGRDGKESRAILLYNRSDVTKLLKRIDDTFPPKDYIKDVYEHLAFYYQIATGDGYGVAHEFDIGEFCRRFHHFPVRVHSALQILMRAGYIDYDENADNEARVKILVDRDSLYQLRNVSADEDRVIVAMLRLYGGLFADFHYIDEALVAQQSGLSKPQVYEILKALSERHLISFIPRKNVPYIRYMQRREDKENMTIPHEVYEDRIEQYKLRIEAMVGYVQRQDRCRSRQLLEYFGEKITHDCGQCDVCLSMNNHTPHGAREMILAFLSDGKRHHATEIQKLPIDTEVLRAVISEMMEAEDIFQEDGYLWSASH